MTIDPSGGMQWLNVESVARHPSHGSQVVAFAIDNPAAGARLPGAGVEVTGWVIGAHGPVVGVRATHDRGEGIQSPLTVARPDVANDYPDAPEAARSGFSFWAPVSPDGGRWQLTIEAILDNGTSVPLATLAGQAQRETLMPIAGERPVAGPDFVIIGAQRGGTTSLHAYLAAHPRIALPATKELHYLTDRHARGSDWYLGQFPRQMPVGSLTGEATPYALFHPLAPARLRAAAPHAKLIVLLRNPVERAYSHFRLERARGDEPLPFAEALAIEPVRLAGEEGRLEVNPTYVSHAHNHFSYLARGDYAPQLARWFAQFPREQFLIIRSEELYASTVETYARVLAFLNLPPKPASFVAHNRTEGPPVDPALREALVRHFAPRNARLRDLLGWDPGWA